jgi:serine/threonine protein kinase
MAYAPMGSLRNNLYSVAQTSWKDKLKLIICVASDLKIIHSQNIIHRDLHSGNILLYNLYSAYIADLGLSVSTSTESEGVCGILPYIAPEVFYGNPYTLKSDIYSFGIVMWEISSGKAVPFNYESMVQFQVQVNDGLRPIITEDTPQCYIDLMKRCWDGNPNNRPLAEEICEVFEEWQNDAKILTKFDKKLKNTENAHEQTFTQTTFTQTSYTRTFTQESYTSEFIPYIHGK